MEENKNKEIKKKEWETPELVDLETKDTKNGTLGFNDGATNYSNIS